MSAYMIQDLHLSADLACPEVWAEMEENMEKNKKYIPLIVGAVVTIAGIIADVITYEAGNYKNAPYAYSLIATFAGITINIDADVIQADGGTRTASITGGFIALSLLFQKLLSEGKIQKNPIRCFLAATSCGIVEGEARLDLCYQEDSRAEADMNFVGTEDGNICELQISGEKRPVTDAELAALIALCKQGITQLIEMEKAILQGEHTYER